MKLVAHRIGVCGITEREKRLAGQLSDPLDLDLVAARGRARDLCQSLQRDP